VSLSVSGTDVSFKTCVAMKFVDDDDDDDDDDEVTANWDYSAHFVKVSIRLRSFAEHKPSLFAT